MPFKMSIGTLTALDIYGHPIGVHLQGDSNYKTRLGSLMTILTYALMLVNFIDLVSQYSDKSAQVERSSLQKELHRNSTIGLSEQPLEIMFGYYIREDNWASIDTNLYNYSLVRTDLHLNDSVTETEIPTFLCSDEKKKEALMAFRPAYIDYFMDRMQLWCFNHADAYLRGTEEGFERSSLRMRAHGKKDCSAKAPTGAHCFHNVIFFKDFYVDLSDQDEPLKHYYRIV